jgi:hypothetical protein
MTVRIQKPAVNIREKLAELERPIGLNGQALLATSTPQEAFNIISAGRKNLIINGGMNVWQRGTSFLDPASGDYTADRWKNSTNPTDISRSTDVPSGEPFTYSMLMAANGSGGTRHAALQGVELPATGSAGPFKVGTTWTFSCWLKGGASGSIFFGIDFRDDPNSGTNAVSVGSTNFNYTTSWQKFTYTFTVGASPGGTNLCLAIILYAGTAPANNLYITGCQLEQGKVATPFEHRSYGEELALCQRYFYKLGGAAARSIGFAYTPSTSEIAVTTHHPVPMRIDPGASLRDDTFASITPNYFRFRYEGNNNFVLPSSGVGVNVSQMTTEGGSFWFSGMSHGLTKSGELRTNESNTGEAYVAFNSEL